MVNNKNIIFIGASILTIVALQIILFSDSDKVVKPEPSQKKLLGKSKYIAIEYEVSNKTLEGSKKIKLPEKKELAFGVFELPPEPTGRSKEFTDSNRNFIPDLMERRILLDRESFPTRELVAISFQQERLSYLNWLGLVNEGRFEDMTLTTALAEMYFRSEISPELKKTVGALDLGIVASGLEYSYRYADFDLEALQAGEYTYQLEVFQDQPTPLYTGEAGEVTFLLYHGNIFATNETSYNEVNGAAEFGEFMILDRPASTGHEELDFYDQYYLGSKDNIVKNFYDKTENWDLIAEDQGI